MRLPFGTAMTALCRLSASKRLPEPAWLMMRSAASMWACREGTYCTNSTLKLPGSLALFRPLGTSTCGRYSPSPLCTYRGLHQPGLSSIFQDHCRASMHMSAPGQASHQDILHLCRGSRVKEVPLPEQRGTGTPARAGPPQRCGCPPL